MPMRVRRLVLVSTLSALVVLVTRGSSAEAHPGPEPAATPAMPPLRDGQHDFDFLLGKWKYHLKRLVHPLTGSTDWVAYEATSDCRPLWGGKAQIDEFDAVGPAGHIQGAMLRLYNPKSQQWSLNWSTAKDGSLSVPTVGSFKDGRGDFYDQEEVNGRMILVRAIWSATTTKHPHFEQSFSVDGGKTWEVNWITDQERVGD